MFYSAASCIANARPKKSPLHQVIYEACANLCFPALLPQTVKPVTESPN